MLPQVTDEKWINTLCNLKLFYIPQATTTSFKNGIYNRVKEGNEDENENWIEELKREREHLLNAKNSR